MAVERAVTGAFVALADTLAADLAAADFHDLLITLCAELLQVSAAGLLLADGRGTLGLAAAVPGQSGALEMAQLTNAEGPGFDCHRTGAPVICADLAAARVRWPRFAPAAHAAGFRSVHSVPLLLRGEALGAIDLFSADPGALSAGTAELAQALAAISAVGLQHRRTIREREVVIGQLQTALDSRILIEQAKGVLAERSHTSVDVAFAALRGHARCSGRKLVEVAVAVVRDGLDIPVRAEPAER
jgi:ANTAR domain/GAF domain